MNNNLNNLNNLEKINNKDYKLIKLIKSINNSYENINKIKLKNNLQTFILNKSNLNNYGCLLIIYTGSYYENIKGLAHLLEHVLYSNKEYFDKIKELSEDLNGFTTYLYTGYYFTSNNKEIFYKIIKEYFIKLFTNIKFEKNTILNEIENINSEFLLNISNDDYIYKNLLELNIIDNYNYKFCIGNKETLLKENIENDLKNFYEKNYYAENMNLFIFNKDDNNINELKNILLCFENIKSLNNHIYINNIDNIDNNINDKEKKYNNYDTIIKNQNKCYKININNYDKTGTIILYYTINLKYFNIFYFYFIKELINRNIKNSLNNILKTNNLISSLDFNICDTVKNFVIIKVKIKQTYYGTKHEDIIITSFNKYLEYLKQNITENNYNIFKNCYKINYIYQNETKDIDDYIYSIIYKLDNSMFINQNIENIINYDIIYDKFEKNKFNELLDNLNIKKSMIILNNYKYSNFKYKTKYYNTKFLIENNNFIINDINFDFNISFNFIDKKTINKINSNNLKENLLLNNKKKLYYNNYITIYSNPYNILDEKIYINIEFTLNNVYDNINNYFYFYLFIYILNDKIKYNLTNDILYGLNFNLTSNKNKLYLMIDGFNFNIENILFYILNFISNYKINENDFYKYKQELINLIINEEKNDFHYKINKHMKFILYDKFYLLKNQIYKLNDLLFLQNYSLNSKIFNIICYFHTKLNISNLISIVSSFFYNNFNIHNINNLNLKSLINNEFKIKNFNDIHNKYLLKSNDINNYVIDYILIIKNNNYKIEVLTDIITEILDNKFFEEFRRKKHYGYVCNVNKNVYGYNKDIITLDFIINISKDNINNINIIKNDIKNFINNNIINIFHNLNVNDFNKIKNSIIYKYIIDKDNDFNIFNSLIINDLNYYNNLINISYHININDIIVFIDNLLSNKKLLEFIIN